MDLADAPGFLIRLGDLQKSDLLLCRNAGERAAEKSQFDILRRETAEGSEPGFDRFRHVGRRDVAAACGDLFLVAEHTVVRTAAMGDEDRDDRVFFHKYGNAPFP